MKSIGSFLRDVWRLSRPYFRSEEKWSAWVLLISIILLNLSMVGMSVVLNFWNRQFYNSLQSKDWQAFLQLLFTWRRTPRGRDHAGLLRRGGGLYPGVRLRDVSEPVAANPLAALADTALPG